MTAGLVTFSIAGREYATALADIREVVRLHALTDLPGMAGPVAGVLDLRGTALPVLDLRPSGAEGRRGVVLVLERPGTAAVGVAVDRVRAVVDPADLPSTEPGDRCRPHPARLADRALLPGYVLEVLRGPDGAVFLVDLPAMVRAARDLVAV